MRRLSLPQLTFLFPLLSFWPVWIWYFRRAGDGSAEPWQLLAVLGIVIFAATRQLSSPRSTVLVCCGLMLYLVSYPSIPPLGRAGIAFLTLFLATSSPKDTPPGIFLLLFLALPLFSTLDFLLSYPLRQLTAYLSLPLLQSAGFEVSILGNSFLWNSKTVLIDAPCSGIRMLYTSMLLTAFLSSSLKLAWRETLTLVLASLAIIIFANVARSSSLFFLEAHPFQASFMERYEAPLHASAGIFVFLCSAAAICGLATSLKKSERSSKRERPSVRFPIQAGSRVSFALLLFLSLVAGLQPFVRSHSKSLTPSNAQIGPTLPPLASALVSSGNLQQVALEPRDAIFAKDFPGRIQRYRGATSELLVRSVFTATRSLHPSSDCFRGLGYSIVPLPSEKDAEGHLWGCFEARSSARSLHVCEHVVSAKNGHWSDIPSWFWSATFRPESGPWNALTRIETKSPLSEAKTTLHTDFTQLSS